MPSQLVQSSLWNLFGEEYSANCRAWHRGAASPILPPKGHGWKRRWTANPDFLHFRGQTFLYYRGNGTLTNDPNEPVHDRIGLGLVETVLPGEMSLRDVTGGQPIIDVGPEGAFDARNVLDPASVVFQDKVWLYYSGDDPTNTHTIGLAVSEDGVHFEKKGAVLPGRAPEIVLKDGILLLLYQTFDEGRGCTLHAATSTDGRQFTPVSVDPIYPRPPGQWDSFSVTTARIHEPGDGWYYLLYGGSAYLADEPDYFGLARSRNLLDWTPHPGNPIFGAGAKGEPDGGALWFPALYETPEQFVMLYEGSRGKYSWDLHSTICMAWIDKVRDSS